MELEFPDSSIYIRSLVLIFRRRGFTGPVRLIQQLLGRVLLVEDSIMVQNTTVVRRFMQPMIAVLASGLPPDSISLMADDARAFNSSMPAET
jgi:hypothetical protein